MRRTYTDYYNIKPEIYFDGEHMVFDDFEEMATWVNARRELIRDTTWIESMEEYNNTYNKINR